MFVKRSAIRTHNPHARPKSERGMATLRVYIPAPYPIGGIYDETVVGGYRLNTTGETVIVTKGCEDGRHQLYSVSPNTGYARHIGCLAEEAQQKFEHAAPGECFFAREVRMLKLDRDEVAAAVYRRPVWYAEKLALGEAPSTDKAPSIPLTAKMFHRSLFVPEGQPRPPKSPGRECRGYCPDLFEQDESPDSPSM